jgi:hypothetical protein
LKGGLLEFVSFSRQSIDRTISINPAFQIAAAGLAGLVLAWLLFGRRLAARIGGALPIAGSAGSAVAVAFGQGFYLDRAYDLAVEWILLPLSAAFGWIDRRLVDGFFAGLGESVAAAGRPRPWLARLRFNQLTFGFLAGSLLLGLIVAVAAGPGAKLMGLR